MISKIRQIISEKCRLSGIRGCMAAGAVTAGIAAFAVICGANSDDISTVSLETDVIPEETASAQTEKRTYSRDMDLFFLEEMNTETAEIETESASEDIAEGNAPDCSEGSEETAAPAEESSDEAEEKTEALTDDTSAETEDETDTSEEELPEESAEESEKSEESEQFDEEVSEEPAESEPEEITDENAERVSARISAANGDEDDGGLSSALDLDVDSEAVTAASSAEGSAEDASESSEESSDIPEMSDEASEKEDDLNDIPEDITLDEENTKPAPQEGAISLFELPEWLAFDENGVPTEYVNVLSGKACAYTASPDALMSTGKTVFQGYVAVDPDVIPYGSELYIVAEDGEVYGYAIAADTGYSVRAGHIIVDLFMNEYDDCIQWGNKMVNIYVLK